MVVVAFKAEGLFDLPSAELAVALRFGEGSQGAGEAVGTGSKALAEAGGGLKGCHQDGVRFSYFAWRTQAVSF